MGDRLLDSLFLLMGPISLLLSLSLERISEIVGLMSVSSSKLKCQKGTDFCFKADHCSCDILHSCGINNPIINPEN